MDKNFTNKKISLVYKNSRLAFIKEQGTHREIARLKDPKDPLSQELKQAHENHLQCLKHLCAVLDNMAWPYSLICRPDIKAEDIEGNFVITVGGDGTLLDASHYCKSSPILGVNSDPERSSGALCIATRENFKDLLQEIRAGTLKPSPIERLSITREGRLEKIVALNDVLYCHKNPAAMSRFSLLTNEYSEAHRASGVWIASAAGSTGGIFSSGSPYLPIESKQGLFRVREPFWSDKQAPKLLAGSISASKSLKLQSTMTEGRIYIDGPHKYLDLLLGECVIFAISEYPLWLFNSEILNKKRSSLVLERLYFRELLEQEQGEDYCA